MPPPREQNVSVLINPPVALIALGALVLFSASPAMAVTQALWVFPSASAANPVTDASARQSLASNAAASGVALLYVSVYSSTPNSAGRYMYDEGAIADFITTAHAAGLKVYAAYGAPDWPTFGCDPNGFPLQRIAEIPGYNAAHPSASFDGVVLDTEPPEPQTTGAYQSLLAQYQCMRDALPPSIALTVAIRFFWDNVIQFPPGSGATKAVYAHVIDMNLRNVVVMGYRDFAGPRDCSLDGIICLDRDQIAYEGSVGKLEVVLAGMETSDPDTTGISNKETFFEEQQGGLNAVAQTVIDRFGILSGLGGFAIHNYGNSYLSGAAPAWPQTNPGFPTNSHEVKVSAVTHLTNGHARLQGTGIANRTYRVEASGSPASGSFNAVGSVTADAAGAFAYDDPNAVGQSRRFYRVSFP